MTTVVFVAAVTNSSRSVNWPGLTITAPMVKFGAVASICSSARASGYVLPVLAHMGRKHRTVCRGFNKVAKHIWYGTSD